VKDGKTQNIIYGAKLHEGHRPLSADEASAVEGRKAKKKTCLMRKKESYRCVVHRHNTQCTAI
jgi:hypothetical protein